MLRSSTKANQRQITKSRSSPVSTSSRKISTKLKPKQKTKRVQSIPNPTTTKSLTTIQKPLKTDHYNKIDLSYSGTTTPAISPISISRSSITNTAKTQTLTKLSSPSSLNQQLNEISIINSTLSHNTQPFLSKQKNNFSTKHKKTFSSPIPHGNNTNITHLSSNITRQHHQHSKSFMSTQSLTLTNDSSTTESQTHSSSEMSTPEQVTNTSATTASSTEQTTEQQQKPKKQKQAKEKKTTQATDASSLGVQAKKSEDFAKWYSQLVVRSELIDYYDISGCYILRPWAFEIWENITAFLDTEFKKLGVKNASFPLLVPRRNLEKEEDHIEGFAAEVAWVTHSGSTKLEEPVAIRPTSETIMYPAFAKWIHSHRDLPLRLNQWCNVLRWEFKDPTPFIRAREFLWQEGHTAYAKQEDADAEVYRILDLYEQAYEELLGCSVIKGHKTDFEKFAGGKFTTTVEGYIPGSGRGIQAATSHSLGQNFAKMFDVTYQDEDGQVKHVWQNSWGFTFRSMGVMIMTHSDDKGLVLPPRIAPTQVVLIPIVKGDNAEIVTKAVDDLYNELKAKGIRAEIDDRTNVSPGFKYNHWELKGVPVRVEVGARDLEKRSAVLARRDLGTKSFASWDGFADSVQALLDTIQNDLRTKAKKEHLDAISTARTWDSFMEAINKNHLGLIPWCGKTECEQAIKVKSGESAKDAGADRSGAAKSLCIPFEQPSGNIKDEKCLSCDGEAENWVLFGRSY